MSFHFPLCGHAASSKAVCSLCLNHPRPHFQPHWTLLSGRVSSTSSHSCGFSLDEVQVVLLNAITQALLPCPPYLRAALRSGPCPLWAHPSNVWLRSRSRCSIHIYCGGNWLCVHDLGKCNPAPENCPETPLPGTAGRPTTEQPVMAAAQWDDAGVVERPSTAAPHHPDPVRHLKQVQMPEMIPKHRAFLS